MRSEEFRAWLEAGGARSGAGRTRNYAVQTIEKNLAELGSPHADLNAAWSADRFQHLRQRLSELRDDYRAGGSDYRVLMPNSEKPDNRLTSWRAWLGQYGKFLAGEPRVERDADRVRQYVLENYVEPGREADADYVDVLVREVNEALGLNQAWPNICQALAGDKFLELAEVGAPERIGAPQSSATVFRFKLSGDDEDTGANRERPFLLFERGGEAFKPVLNFNRAIGRSAYRIKPPGASNKADEAIEVDTIAEVAAAMLLEGRPARVQSVRGGSVNYVAYGKEKLVRYELDPEIARQIGVAPNGQIGSDIELDEAFLERLRLLFLQKHPDFRTFSDSGSFGPAEDNEKRALIEDARRLIGDHENSTDEVLGGALLNLIQGKGPRDTFLLGWRMANGLTRVRSQHAGIIEEAAGRLARGAEPIADVAAFVEKCWPALSDGQEASLPYGDSRTIPTMVRALIDPERMMGIRSQPTDNASKMLRGTWAFSKQLTAGELESVMDMARQIFGVMRDQWAWAPRDFWDVQGFIWETCQKRLPSPEEQSDPELQVEHPMTAPTNLILYGPPGTGKTYATAAEAVQLCGEPVPEDRDELMETYKRLSDAGRIEFVTFHQSVAYEQFVECLHPTQASKEGGAGFELKPKQGVFRRIARRAETSTGQRGSHFSIGDRQIFKMSIGEASNPDDAYLFEEAIQEGHIILGFDDIDWSDPKFEKRQAIIDACRELHQGKDFTAQNGAVQSPFIFRNWMKEGDIVIISKGTKLFRAIGVITGGYRFAPREGGDYGHQRDVEWLWVDRAGVPIEEIYARAFSMRTIYEMYRQDLNLPALERYANSQRQGGDGAPQHFVLIIDEINRANISKVFGELITLLEPDKRIGRPNALMVRLPYSGDPFGVPSNLHIIGTMNTADRSIALLDTALRRRFEFRELMPDSALLGIVDGIDLGRLLETINERIEYLFDREHQIGHAYFMGCRTEADLAQVMRHKVIPLLAEYFYEDWAKVAAALGDGDDGEGDREGRFIDRRRLKAPKGLGADEDAAPRYRRIIRDSFDFTAFTAG